MELNDTCFIGIWGESGIGKTTLARLVYDEIHSKFDATCFLDNVREDSERVGIVSLQKKFLSELGFGELDIDVFSEGAKIIRKFLGHKKVLIILDDVSERSQLENLAGNKEWFGVGSKILITTTDKTLLTLYEQYEVGRLHYDESLKLLRLVAFKKYEPEDGYLDLSKEVTNILELCDPHSTSGIEVLIEKSMLNVTHSNSDLWQNAKEDQDMLGRIQSMRKDIFLPTYLYDWLLQEASKEYLHMHDLLQKMGRDIVFHKSPTNAGGRNRLWSLEDIDLVLKENKGTKHVQSIVLKTQQGFKADWDPNCFSKMINLRLLDMSNVHLSKKLESLPTALKFLRWDDYAKDCLPSIEKLCNLESLQLCNNNIQKLWEGNPVLNKLRIINMSGSESLSETPDFSGTPNLEELLLNRCRKLVRVHESVGQLRKLVKSSLKKCKRLEFLPTKLETNNLQEFILMDCVVLEKLPEFGRNMESLYFLDVRGTDITEIPQSIIHLTNLKCLDLTLCSRLKSIPELPPNLIISASNCGLLEPTYALGHLYASCAPEGPIHLFYDFQLWTRIPTWFERWEYFWGKDTSGEFVTITVDISSNVVADSNEERWGIAVCVVFQFLSQAWQAFSVDWKFKADTCHPNKTKINGTPAHYMHDCRVYVGFYPFEAKDCRQHASGEGSQLDLTLDFPATNIMNGLHDLKVMGCGWRLACKKDFDEQSESGSPSPPRLDFLER
ncbi:hypothetical protein K1719_020712 [Acacia pycnantha]|nr:hypothetical protein K1719_020712 [Acacia pycnantha]